MKTDKKKIYLLEIILLAILFLALFESSIITKGVLAVILVVYTLILKTCLKKRSISSINKKEVFVLMIIFAIIYLALFYLSGLYFGYYTATVKFTPWGITHYLIPVATIIIASEYIRYILLSQKGKENSAFTLLAMIIIDVIVYSGVYNISKLDDFLTVMGSIIFSSVSCNLLYNYTSKRYGYKPVIGYRLITGLYSYIIPIIPDIHIFFKAVVRMIYPYLMYLVLEYTYAKNDKASDYKTRKTRIINTTALVVCMCLISMLISCEFKYGIIVVGSGSMTGTIDKGDAVVFVAYDGQAINEGEIIIFDYEGTRTIHRVVEAKIVNGEYRYYTKGDANTDEDDWYITSEDIVGISLFKIKYIGYPTLWVQDIFN